MKFDTLFVSLLRARFWGFLSHCKITLLPEPVQTLLSRTPQAAHRSKNQLSSYNIYTVHRRGPSQGFKHILDMPYLPTVALSFLWRLCLYTWSQQEHLGTMDTRFQREKHRGCFSYHRCTGSLLPLTHPFPAWQCCNHLQRHPLLLRQMRHIFTIHTHTDTHRALGWRWSWKMPFVRLLELMSTRTI